MSEALTSDELGEAGESLFGKLCVQAKLICNKAARDRGGWDFRVEFPMRGSPDETLDQREPRVCLVQLKCTAGARAVIRARLSSIERLAKERGPAAIVVFRMRPDGTELMGYLIHLLNEELAKVLRRLRVAERDGRADINHMWISFDYRKGRRFTPNAEGLCGALAAICPEDVDGYVEEKRHQLANLGYEEGPALEGEAVIWIESKEHLTKIISGLAPLKPLSLQTYDRRFGIRVPYRGSLLKGLEELTIDLPTMGPCSIVVRAGPLRPPAVFECEAFVPYPVQGGPWLVIRHPTVSVLFHEDSFSLESAGNLRVDRYDLPTWIVLLRGLSYLAEGGAKVELEFRGSRIQSLSTPDDFDGPFLDQLPELLAFVERIDRAFGIAGVTAKEAFALNDVWSAPAMQMSLDICFNPHSRARFEFDAIDEVTGEQMVAALYFNTVEFAGVGLTFATKVILERKSLDTGGFASTNFELLDIRPAVADIDAYGAEIAEDQNISMIIHPDNVTLL